MANFRWFRNSSLGAIRFLWPPLDAARAAKSIKVPSVEDSAEWMFAEQERILHSFQEEIPREALDLAKEMEQSETKRRESLETKAATFVGILSIVLSIVAAVPWLFSDRWELTTAVAAAAAVLYLLTLIHLIVACYFAVQVRRISGIANLSAREVEETVSQRRTDTRFRVAAILARAKFNEKILLRKSNALFVAEEMFQRGIRLLLITASSLLLGKVVLEL